MSAASHRFVRPLRAFPAQVLAASLVLSALVVLAARPAEAQETTGRIVGLVTDEATRTPQVGVTVILQGSQGEDASLTDDRGEYTFVNLTVGTYTVRFYNATSSTNVERHDLLVSAGATLRADVVIPSQPAAQETYVIKKKAASVDVGSSRLGLTLNEDFMTNLALDRTFGDLVLKAPGAFLETSGGISIGGASGLENTYVMDGLNVTGMELGNIMNKQADAAGGSNLTLDFVKELQISTGGYRAEFGGAMGGVVNVVTKSGTNDLHGSAFMYWAPYWLSGSARQVDTKGSVLSGVDKPDYDTNVGFEVGGPIVKDKAFFWVGFAPRLEKNHFFRDVSPLVEGSNGAAPTTGDVVLRTRTRELRQSYQYGVKLDFVPTPDHKLTLSLFGTPTASEHVRAAFTGEEADSDPRYALQSLHKNNTDVTATWMSQLLERRLRLDASLGLHRETFSDHSPYSDLSSINQREYHGFSLYNFEQIAGCEPTTNASTGAMFDPCPVGSNAGGYRTGGYGMTKSYTGNRWMADVKATALLNKNEIKAGTHFEVNTFDQDRYYSGPPGGRGLVQAYRDYTQLWNFFTIPKGKYATQFSDGAGGSDDPNMDGKPFDLADPALPFYQDHLAASVKSVNSAYFLQDTIHPLPNLTIDLGIRYENQKMYDFRGAEFLNTDNLGPRLGVVYDPSNDGRSKIFASFGQFFETVPMNLAARYFGGEGILDRVYLTDSCNPPVTQWKGTGKEAQTSNCASLPPLPTFFINAGAPYPTQSHLQGQHHNEILAGFQHALTEDLVVGMSYTHRWLGAVIEDGSADRDLQAVLANPGDVPQAAKDDVQHEIDAKMTEVMMLTNAPPTSATSAQIANAQAQIATLKTKLNALQVLGSEPKPERTYDALTLTANKRLGRSWYFQGSYTYSRLIGNYNGLYDADSNYFAPNGGTAYDTPDLVLNKRGPLANDRPHSGHVDAFYQLPVGRGVFTGGLSFAGYSGVPRNYVAALFSGQQLVFLLPRGSAGRTPSVYQVDAKLGYKQQLTKTTALELFFDLFNLLNDRTALSMDDNYTTDSAAAIVNGNQNDLAHAKNSAGLPIQKNTNFGNPTAFQAPIHGRMGLRFLF